MLAGARAFGEMNLHDLPTNASNRVYFDFMNARVIHYPMAMTIPVAILSLLPIIAGFLLAFRRGGVVLRRIALAAILNLLILALVSVLVWWLFSFGMPDSKSPRAERLAYATNARIMFVLMLISAMLTLVGFHVISRFMNGREVFFGAALPWILLVIGTCFTFQGASYLFAWPLFFASLGWLIVFSESRGGFSSNRAWFGVIGLIPMVTMMSPTLYLVWVSMTGQMAWVVALLLNLSLGFASPLVGCQGRSETETPIIDTA